MRRLPGGSIRAKAVTGFWCRRWAGVAVAAVFVLLPSLLPVAALAQAKKVYVPNAAGDVSKSLGAIVASEMTVALAKRGLEALTYTNLSSQLQEEQQKELFGCSDSGCIDELVTNFGIADRVFCQVTRLSAAKNEYHVEVSHFVKGKLATGGKVSRMVACPEVELPSIAAALALEAMGLQAAGAGGGVPFREEDIGGGVSEWNPTGGMQYIVRFESTPSGAVVMVDGELACQDTSKGCSRMLSPGAHQVGMQKEAYVKRSETVMVTKDTTVRWELEENFGTLSVSSTPPGLDVQVNRKATGKTPVKNLELAPGNYEVLVVGKCHHESGKKVALERGEREVVDVSPSPIEGAIDVTAVDEQGNALRADVYVDGVKVGTAPGVHKVSVCAKQVEVKANGGSFKKDLSVLEKQVLKVAAVLKSGGPGDIEWMYSSPAGLEFAKTETTLAQYAACVDAGACTKDHHRTKDDARNCNWGYSDRGAHPMNCVDWYGAKQFCEWAGGRLPTEEEWFAEASNGGERTYAWGNKEVNCDLAVWGDGSNTDGCGKDRTWPVCSKTAGNSVSGLCDVSGNVWEWTSSLYDSEHDWRVVRGGSWNFGVLEALRAAARLWYGPGGGSSIVGVRCVRSSR